jgi:hypothetical protein
MQKKKKKKKMVLLAEQWQKRKGFGNGFLLLRASTCQHSVHPGLSARVMWSCQQT